MKKSLMKGTVASFGLKITSVFLAFILNLLLAQILGSEGLGSFALVISYLGLLSIPAKLGFPQLLVRDVAVYEANDQWGLLHGLLRYSYGLVVLLSCIITLITVLVTWSSFSRWNVTVPMSIALISLPLNSLRVLNQSVMSGLHKVVKGQLPENVGFPLISLLLVLITHAVSDVRIDPVIAIVCYIVASLLTAMFSFYQLSHALPKSVLQEHAIYRPRHWLRTAIPFMACGALFLINSQTDIIMLGAIDGTRSVGLYVVANRLSSLVVFILMASNSVLGPNIARLHASQNTAKLQKIVLKSSQAVLFASLSAAVVLVCFRHRLLGLFGSEFVTADTILIILIVGQIVNAAVGPVGLLLNMSGHENLSLLSLLVSAAVNISLNSYLIPMQGALGAAVATASSMVLWNLISAFFVFKRLRMNPTAVPLNLRLLNSYT